MDQLHGDRATWRFDGESVLIRYHTGRRTDSVLDALGQCVLPLAAIASVEFRTERRGGWGRSRHWRLRARLDHKADPYAAVGSMLTEASDPFLLTGDADTELVAEYYAEQLGAAASATRETGVSAPAGLATHLVPPLPLHIQTVEGTASFDGTSAVLTWSGYEARSRKRKQQRREFPVARIARAEWVPPTYSGYFGYLRVVERADPDATGLTAVRRYLGGGEQPADSAATAPEHDLACLRFRGSRDQAEALLLAATITAHTWVRDKHQS
ncbi:hypothetical protein F4561_005909 [Lipingzhangella halophila]|uniref:DUF4429 domain-containing protein n=1 Tax=Lipingzhangella halophila TaxID=1783352 RepID=A0A7W7RN11_9ACTN|nr:DUF4429 domain-containing protein [Lipingzhangella halophila]MBB4935015.1 hypothetical protein [Lipingzhangella halophila]